MNLQHCFFLESVSIRTETGRFVFLFLRSLTWFGRLVVGAVILSGLCYYLHVTFWLFLYTFSIFWWHRDWSLRRFSCGRPFRWNTFERSLHSGFRIRSIAFNISTTCLIELAWIAVLLWRYVLERRAWSLRPMFDTTVNAIIFRPLLWRAS